MTTLTPTVFNFNNSTQIRMFTDENQNPWFLAKDVCDILGYANPHRTLSLHCKEGGVTKRYTPTSSGEQEMTYINEGNLYRLIVKSKKPEAEKFEMWVMEEVLPTIRKTGEYRKPAQSLEKIDNNDMANLSRLVWLMSKGFNCESALSAGIWHSLRAVTQTASPEKFNVQDLPLLAEECKRIIAKVNQFKKVVYDAEKKMIKTVIRKSGDISEILAEIEQQTNQITETSTQALAMIERYEEVAINKLVSRVH